jgi:hypothetical protein
MTAALIVLIGALAYIVHERLDLARFNRQARGADGVPGNRERLTEGGK